jgi:GNAT superfamily N-acetyltransferase
MSEEKLAICHARPEDWLKLRSIRLEALNDTPDAYGSTYDGVVTFSEDRWRSMTEQSTYFLAERDGEVVGMVSGGLNDDHPGTRWLYGMYVTPSARGGAAAPMLVDAVSEWARECGASELFLHVTTSVERAKAFYQKMGFEPTGESFVMNRDSSLVLMSMRRAIVNE